MLDLETRHTYRTLLDAEVLGPDRPSAPAIIFLRTGHDPIEITRRRFQEETERMAAGLTEHGIRSGDVIIIAHTQDLEGIFLFWGALRIGAIPSIFHTVTEKIPEEVYYADIPPLIEHTRARALYTTPEFAADMRSLVDCQVYSSEDLAAQVSGALDPFAPSDTSVAFLQHSSGTTGAKKGVALSHESVLNQLASYSHVLGIQQDDVVVSWLPLYHDAGLIAGHLMPLVEGIPLVLMSPFDWVKHPGLLFRAISEYSGTLCWLPNFAYNHCASRVRRHDLEGVRLESARVFVNMSEPVQAISHDRFIERFQPYGLRPSSLTASYAMAENVFAVTQSRVGEQATVRAFRKLDLQEKKMAIPCSEDEPGSIRLVGCGSAIPWVQVKVVDRDLTELPEGNVGEFAVTGDSLFNGYYRRPDLTEEAFVDGWYLTGDLGFLYDGEAFVTGRKKDLIIHAGKNIHPHDIEALVGRVAGVHPGRAVCFGVFDEDEGTELVAVVCETDLEDERARRDLVQHIRQYVAENSSVTLAYVDVEDRGWLLKTSSGKISRGANRQKWLSEHGLPSS